MITKTKIGLAVAGSTSLISLGTIGVLELAGLVFDKSYMMTQDALGEPGAGLRLRILMILCLAVATIGVMGLIRTVTWTRAFKNHYIIASIGLFAVTAFLGILSLVKLVPLKYVDLEFNVLLILGISSFVLGTAILFVGLKNRFRSDFKAGLLTSCISFGIAAIIVDMWMRLAFSSL